MSESVRVRTRAGAGLVEVVIAVVLFGIIATSNLAVLRQLTLRQLSVSAGAARYGTQSEAANYLASVPYESLAVITTRMGCRTLSAETTRSQVCVTTVSGSTTRTVTVRWLPTDTRIAPDTVVLTRSKAPVGQLRPYGTTWSNSFTGY